MTTFYICRHGETENNKHQRLSGWIDTPLTALGTQNAVASAAKLHGIKFDRIISSDLGRAFMTAYIISRKLGFASEIERDARLREVNYGNLANASYADYPKLSPEENTNHIPPNGESLAQMQQRVTACVEEIAQGNPDKTILIAAHDGTINAVRASLTQQPMGIIDARSDNPHDFVATFTMIDGEIAAFAEI